MRKVGLSLCLPLIAESVEISDRKDVLRMSFSKQQILNNKDLK